MKKLFAIAMTVVMLLSLSVGAFAATIPAATIDMTKTANLTIYKYDFSNAEKDGVWNSGSYVSTGSYDAYVNNTLGTAAIREGATSGKYDLENGQSSNGYAIKGVEYTYKQVADFYQFSESEKDGKREDAHVEFLYKFNKTAAADLLAAIGLANGKNSYANANALDNTSWFYQSDVLNAAIKAALTENSTTLKNALETFVEDGAKMPETDENGRSIVTALPLGLYLVVETKVPEMVTSTTNPFFVSLPMTSVDGGATNGQGSQVTTGGHDWLYDITLYPKNTTGIVTLEKTVREASKDTGKNNASSVITDGFDKNATASTGDTVEYQIVSTLPSITSKATSLSKYDFVDVLSRGLSYVGGPSSMTMEWFEDEDCTKLVATWKQTDGKFTVSRSENNDGSHTMNIAMTAAGLAEINDTAYTNANGKLFVGYSNYTLRIRYDAKLNSDESLVYGDAGNPNTVVLTWKRTNTAYYDTLIDDAHIYSYGMDLTKKFSDGKDAQDMFDHVLFKLQNATDGYYVVAELNEDEGIWYVTGHTNKESAATAINPVTWNGKKGQVVVKGLEDDEYIVTELETYTGYTLLKENIHVEIISEDDADRPCAVYDNQAILGVIQNDPRYNFDGGLDLHLANMPQEAMAHNYQTAHATVDGNPVSMDNDEMDTASTNALALLTVVNTKGFDLPETGENTMNTMATTGGILLAVAAAAGLFFLLVPARKKEQQ